MNRPPYVTKDRLKHFITEAIKEDIENGDHSTLGSVPAHSKQKAHLIIKEDCLLAGIDLAIEIFNFYDPSLQIEVLKNDGEQVSKGEIAFIVSGNASSILSMERLVLNCMQRMSGIATLSKEMSDLVKGTKTKILDTRKTTPNFRMCEKWAVYMGGATNHRYGLFDMIMLKDNHNDFAGGIVQSVTSVRKYLQEKQLDLKIEVETRNLLEVQQAIDVKADIIMLDNMSILDMEKAVLLIDGCAKTEASGGITKERIMEIASIGVDYISSGSIIYRASVKDMSLKAIQ